MGEEIVTETVISLMQGGESDYFTMRTPKDVVVGTPRDMVVNAGNIEPLKNC